MLTLHNENADGLAVTLYRVHDVEDADAPPIPSGQVVTIIEGVGRDKGRQAVWLWFVSWRGRCYAALPEELRPARVEELERVGQ